MTPVLEIKDLHQIFEQGTINENHVLKGIDLTVLLVRFLQNKELFY
jgi:putative ABC transport system ATP-binding protein